MMNNNGEDILDSRVQMSESFRVCALLEEIHTFHWRHGMLLIEIVLLVLTAFIPQGQMDYLANTIISFVCAMQVQTFRKIRGNAFASTMCTGNLRSGTEALWNFMRNGDKKEIHKCLCLYGIIMFFIIGAIIGSAISLVNSHYAIPIDVVLYVTAFVMMTRWDMIKKDD